MHTRLVYISRTPDFSVRVPLVQSSIKIPLLKFSFINTTCIKVLASYLHTHIHTMYKARVRGQWRGRKGGGPLTTQERALFFPDGTHTYRSSAIVFHFLSLCRSCRRVACKRGHESPRRKRHEPVRVKNKKKHKRTRWTRVHARTNKQDLWRL